MAVVKHIKSCVLYEYLGENKFVNLTTKQTGQVTDEQAKNVFKISADATELISEYPLIKELIFALKLKMEK
jgi:hypothetical protein